MPKVGDFRVSDSVPIEEGEAQLRPKGESAGGRGRVSVFGPFRKRITDLEKGTSFIIFSVPETQTQTLRVFITKNIDNPKHYKVTQGRQGKETGERSKKGKPIHFRNLLVANHGKDVSRKRKAKAKA